MAKNGNKGDNHRNGAVKERIQVFNSKIKKYVEIDTDKNKIIKVKKTDGPFKGVREV